MRGVIVLFLPAPPAVRSNVVQGALASLLRAPLGLGPWEPIRDSATPSGSPSATHYRSHAGPRLAVTLSAFETPPLFCVQLAWLSHEPGALDRTRVWEALVSAVQPRFGHGGTTDAPRPPSAWSGVPFVCEETYISDEHKRRAPQVGDRVGWGHALSLPGGTLYFAAGEVDKLRDWLARRGWLVAERGRLALEPVTALGSTAPLRGGDAARMARDPLPFRGQASPPPRATALEPTAAMGQTAQPRRATGPALPFAAAQPVATPWVPAPPNPIVAPRPAAVPAPAAASFVPAAREPSPPPGPAHLADVDAYASLTADCATAPAGEIANIRERHEISAEEHEALDAWYREELEQNDALRDTFQRLFTQYRNVLREHYRARLRAAEERH